MENLKYIALVLLIFCESALANSKLECKVDQFHVPNVEITVANAPDIKKTSASFMDDDNNYWHLAAYELHKKENLYLLKGMNNLTDSKAIITTALSNYINRLEDKMFYTTHLRESFPVSISTLSGSGYIIDATFANSTVNEKFAFWMIVKDDKIFFGDLHITTDMVEPSIQVAQERLTDFIKTCEIVADYT
ncbi:MAG: hypothetical protein COB27_002040 [Moritella sp.]|uniref:hypothetical protein n=1 Tax=Moritella sp. TaxID=78556 RepID=UPI0021704C2C|nr:hypothetical protein [Moritella sp.]MBL1415648.1 hypothetical protein [Moritella sp.]